MIRVLLADDHALIRARAAGARGILLKDTPNREILAAIRTVASGKERSVVERYAID